MTLYNLTTDVSLPLTSTDGTLAARPATYTTLSIPAGTRGQLPNGTSRASSTTLVGTVSGTNTAGYNVTTAFAYSPTSGFRLVGNYSANANGYHNSASVTGVNTAEQLVGNSSRYVSSSTSTSTVGQDAWLSNADGTTVSLGLSGPNFSYTNTALGAVFMSSKADALNGVGQVLGSTSRYGGDSAATPSANLGTASFIYSGATTTQIGLSGIGYQVATANGTYSNSANVALGPTGSAVGNASLYYDAGTGSASNTYGNDGFLYFGGNTRAVGMYQSGVAPVVSGDPETLSYSRPVTFGTATVDARSTTLVAVNASGQAAGSSAYYRSGSVFAVGNDAFVYTPTTGTYTQVGLTSNGFTGGGTTSYVSTTGARSSTIVALNNGGAVAGTSTVYSTSGTTGTAAFYANAAGISTAIGLTDAIHTNSAGVGSGGITNLTDSGLVGGSDARYVAGSTTSLGQDAFVYDTITGQTYAIDPLAATNSTNYETSQILYLSEDGYAVGTFSEGTGSTAASLSPVSSFIWSEAGGLLNLGTSISPSLSADGYKQLLSAYYDTSGGNTIYATALNTAGTSTNLVTLSAVPEPATVGVLAMAATALLGRRRRDA